MIVWVLEVGQNADRYIGGVFSSPEKAMEAWPVRGDMLPSYSPDGEQLPLEWFRDASAHYWLSARGEDAASVTPYEVNHAAHS